MMALWEAAAFARWPRQGSVHSGVGGAVVMGRRTGRGWQAPLAVTVTLGMAVIIAAHARPVIDKDPYSSVLAALGDALFIAGVLGYSVNRIIKAQLVKDVAGTVVTYLSGVNAPQEYIDRLRDSLSLNGSVCLSAEWTLELSWHEDRRVVRVDSTSKRRSQNISNTDWLFRMPWLPHSVSGVPEASRFISYEASAQQPAAPGRHASVEAEREWNAQELVPYTVVRADGSIKLEDKFLHQQAFPGVRPGGWLRTRTVGATFQPVPGGIPLVNPTPTLQTVVVIKGEACEDLNIHVYLGMDEIEVEPEPVPMQYRCGFTHRQATIRVEWSVHE